MTHEWVEQEKKRLAEKFENYPQRLLDEWYAIPEEYRDVRLKKYNLWPEIANIEASIREGSPVNSAVIHMLFTYTDEIHVICLIICQMTSGENLNVAISAVMASLE